MQFFASLTFSEMSPRCFGKIRRCSIFHASRTATASMAAGTIVLAGSQRLENTLDPVDFQHNVQCAGFRFYMILYHRSEAGRGFRESTALQLAHTCERFQCESALSLRDFPNFP